MNSRGDATSWAVVLTAATSLVSMICLYQIDNIVHGTLYNYGLQFSYDWAAPYWNLTQIGFTVGWLNIIIAFAVQLINIRTMRRTEQHETAIEKAWKTAKTSEAEKAPEESAQEPQVTEPTKSPEETPTQPPESAAQDKKEEPQRPEETPKDEPQPQEINPDEMPTLAGL